MSPSHFSKINFNIILPSKIGSSKWSPFFRFPHQNPSCTSSRPHTCYMPCPSLWYWKPVTISDNSKNIEPKWRYLTLLKIMDTDEDFGHYWRYWTLSKIYLIGHFGISTPYHNQKCLMSAPTKVYRPLLVGTQKGIRGFPASPCLYIIINLATLPKRYVTFFEKETMPWQSVRCETMHHQPSSFVFYRFRAPFSTLKPCPDRGSSLLSSVTTLRVEQWTKLKLCCHRFPTLHLRRLLPNRNTGRKQGCKMRKPKIAVEVRKNITDRYQIVDFRRGWTQFFRLLSYYATWDGLKPTFRDCLLKKETSWQSTINLINL